MDSDSLLRWGFEVRVNESVVFSKKELARYPEEGELLPLISAAL